MRWEVKWKVKWTGKGKAAAGKVTKEVVGKGEIKGSGKGREM
jgi:hypothetical protein